MQSLFVFALLFASFVIHSNAQTCPPTYNVYVNPSQPSKLVPCGTSTTAPGVTPTVCPTGAVCLTVTTNLPGYQSLCCVLIGTDLGAGTVSPGTACSTYATCSGGASCIGGLCTCPSGTINTGGVCAVSTVAPVCTVGQVQINGQCLNQVSPGAACTVSSQCLNSATCVNFICTCPTGLILSNSACVASSSNPVCTTGQVLINGQCFNQVGVGSACTVSTQCTGGSTCINNICAFSNQPIVTAPPPVATLPSIMGCAATQVTVNGMCYNRVGPDQTCTFSAQCTYGSQCDPVIHYCKCVSPQINMGGTCAVPGRG